MTASAENQTYYLWLNEMVIGEGIMFQVVVLLRKLTRCQWTILYCTECKAVILHEEKSTLSRQAVHRNYASLCSITEMLQEKQVAYETLSMEASEKQMVFPYLVL